MTISRSLFLLGAGLFLAGQLRAADPVAPAPAAASNQVITVTGAVPDQATKTIILNRLREVYGVDRVVDQISVGGVIMPANWAQHVQALISPQLKAVTRGELSVDGNTVNVKGDVASDANRQQVTSQIASSLNPTYVVKSQLRVTMAEQSVLDQALANRIVEFESGSAKITAAGQGILDEMNNALKQFNGRRVEVIGHTDSQGARNSNVVLSKARADAVKAYLVQKGIAADSLIPIGMGPDRPVAPNNTEDGRRRNRRIEFNLSQ
ncbi:OmpA family protein [Chitinimonas sp. BJB300]|uniref:OmpA family protein n=1 Tax=Chitinimonas sp. BJB300 TaxID=1559339 RepID=UPI000C0CA366|nr:OmpA family protein [Chitinimonas sp. BJB300]PHV13374.1 cell envelope biogenesis protein OmpA [Chitinimonas sp. BJB300]TSJ85291.1 OmpA family protein [Chitinimonas sp. BJB300]